MNIKIHFLKNTESSLELNLKTLIMVQNVKRQFSTKGLHVNLTQNEYSVKQ